jgi:hypothetical protein
MSRPPSWWRPALAVVSPFLVVLAVGVAVAIVVSS